MSLTCVAVDCRDIYDKMRADLRLSKEEAQRIETSRAPKVNITTIAYILYLPDMSCGRGVQV